MDFTSYPESLNKLERLNTRLNDSNPARVSFSNLSIPTTERLSIEKARFGKFLKNPSL
jgi:hypothetical protein